MAYGEGKLTTIHDRVNFYKDVYDDPGVHFEREGNKISLVTGKGIVLNDKLIIHSEDALNHAFDTYKPLQNHLNENQQAVLSWLIDCYGDDGDPIEALSDLYDETMPTEWKTCLDAAYETFDNQQKFQLLHAFAEWGMKNDQ